MIPIPEDSLVEGDVVQDDDSRHGGGDIALDHSRDGGEEDYDRKHFCFLSDQLHKANIIARLWLSTKKHVILSPLMFVRLAWFVSCVSYQSSQMD